ncbi:single myb histone 4 [Carex littledalei]|uniref:Single myb histone 4 n=1 Tax=Carex littledalei TaxID=544730 RepID=A0A833QEY0_9POAL|nr:single myb histone 4 [Carex littledalei]
MHIKALISRLIRSNDEFHSTTIEGGAEELRGWEVGKVYRLKEASFGIKTPVLKQKDPTQQHRKLQNNISTQSNNNLSRVHGGVADPIEEEAKNAASRIADAEAKCYFAPEAAKNAESISKMADNAEAFLSLAKEINDRSVSMEEWLCLAKYHFPIADRISMIKNL